MDGGLFGRRDALLLLLASSGLSFEQISAVHRNNIRLDRDIVVVDGVHPVRLDPDTYHAKISPADVYRRWAQITEFLDRTPSTRLLAQHLDAHTLPVNAMTIDATGAVTGRKQTGPLVTPIDRWGIYPHQRACAHCAVGVLDRQRSSRRHLAAAPPASSAPPASRYARLRARGLP